ncbi:cation diffusion facilitator family transporter [Fusibacter bizertensis]
MSPVMTKSKSREEIARNVTLVGFLVNAFLTVFKILAGIVGNSAAMIADGVHSLSDFFTDIVVLVGIKFTEKPADEEHNYGHGKYETLATVVISIALFAVGYKILTTGLHNIYMIWFQGELLESPKVIALVAAIASIISKEALYQYTIKIGKKINSNAVIANGWHHRSDAFSSIGTLLGIGGAYFLGTHWAWLDPMASVVVSVFIFKVAFEIFMPAINELLESSLKDEEIAVIRTIINQYPEILNYHHLRTRRIGDKVAVDVHLMFERNLSIEVAHDYATQVESDLKKHFGMNSIINTHLEAHLD